MNRCLITYEDIPAGTHYSEKGLRMLSPRLQQLRPFPYSVEEQVREAALRARHMSIQGLQPKLSVQLKVAAEVFTVVNIGGRYIIKPQNPTYPELPENEDLTMRLGAAAGIEVPLHGLLHCADQSRSYFIQRFDRTAKAKLAVEDFAQLSGESRETKYRSSLEKVTKLTEFCTFPAIERARLFRRVLFNFLVGNEDMHLKNYSVITRGQKTELAPAYDYLNTTAVFRKMGRSADDIEESALPLNGKKRRFVRADWVIYLARERLELPEKVVTRVLTDLYRAREQWHHLIDISFLSPESKRLFREIVAQRTDTLFS